MQLVRPGVHDGRHDEERRHRPRGREGEVRRLSGEDDRAAGAGRRFHRQRAGRARDRAEDRRAAPRRVRRPRNAAPDGEGDQAAEAAREPDRSSPSRRASRAGSWSSPATCRSTCRSTTWRWSRSTARKAIAFCKAMEFTALTGRVATKTGADPAEIAPATLEIAGWPPGGGAPAHGPDMGISERPVPVPSSSKQGRLALDPEAPRPARTNGGSGRETISSLGNPQALVEARRKAAGEPQHRRLQDIIASGGSRTSSAGWNWRRAARAARDRGRRRSAPAPCRRRSAASRWRSSRASPATSRSATARGDGDIFGGGLEKDQVPLADALAALKPVLEDSAVLKIGARTSKTTGWCSPATASRWRRSTT